MNIHEDLPCHMNIHEYLSYLGLCSPMNIHEDLSSDMNIHEDLSYLGQGQRIFSC